MVFIHLCIITIFYKLSVKLSEVLECKGDCSSNNNEMIEIKINFVFIITPSWKQPFHCQNIQDKNYSNTGKYILVQAESD